MLPLLRGKGRKILQDDARLGDPLLGAKASNETGWRNPCILSHACLSERLAPG